MAALVFSAVYLSRWQNVEIKGEDRGGYLVQPVLIGKGELVFVHDGVTRQINGDLAKVRKGDFDLALKEYEIKKEFLKTLPPAK